MIREKLNYIYGGAFFLLLALVFWFFSNPRHTQEVQAGFLGMISPFLKQGSGLQRKYNDVRRGLKTLDELEAEVKGLRLLNKQLSATNQLLSGYEADNKRLRNSLGFREKSEFQLMPARVIARDASTWYQKVVIDRGAAELVEPDLAVLTPEGLVGKTTVVAEHSSEVVLIADENCMVSATVEGTREQGIVKGERPTGIGMPTIGLGFLSKQANLQPGRNVFTSGVGGVYPSGLTIGQIIEFKIEALNGYATIKPAVDLSSIEDVFVVVGGKKK
ncbi:MAG: rod shape-determining protein MreC [Chthoniobacteraceae bacterium]